ncbi:hypothetical protein FPOA_12047 [Fusarium poae]|uniref:PNPLA domain-containing protein n=2 Tax=Fusarium poae TaxID=36050 RepID=A0A1B8A982_FUSPO|nr:hypothetical protein FPOA_12421 [Fusarium poae]OBS17495.1 hypothetical protein FPOA_12047 [Fusarium poae]
MSPCRHTCWLKPWSLGIERGVEVTDRPQKILKEFKDPNTESAGLLVLIGNQSKQTAFKKLSFQTGRIQARTGGEIHLLASSLKENRHKRIIIADTDVSGRQPKPPSLSSSPCHAIKVLTDTTQHVADEAPNYENLLQKSLFASADVICIFVDDLGEFDESLKRLHFWLRNGPPSSSPVRPHILLVVRQESRQRYECDLNRFVSEHQYGSSDSGFHSITLVGVPRMSGKGRRRNCGQTRRWQVLGPVLSKALDTSRQARRRSDSIFSVHHLSHFLQYAASVALSSSTEPLSFVKISRLLRGVARDLSHHIKSFFEKFDSIKTFQQVAIPLVASSLLLDHYSPGMHPFDCHQVFHELYEDPCFQASSGLASSSKKLMPPSETAMQDEIGIPYYNVQRSFDVKVGTSSGALAVTCLDILGWNVDDCMSHLKQFAQQSFIQRSGRLTRLLSRLPLFSSAVWLFELIYTFLTDSKYSAEGLEKLLIETYGQSRGTADISLATSMGTHIGVTLTRARDGSVFLATNYNSVTAEAQDSDYHHLELQEGQAKSKWWQILRCATAAPYYFKPARIGDLEVFQDGGLAVNNPVCIAIREATLLSPDLAEPSVVVSLGTGSASDDDSNSSGLFSERFFPRLSRALWKQTGSKVTWKHLLSHQRAASNTKLFRFDVDFMGEEPLLDEVSMVEHVQLTAHSTAAGSQSLRQLCRQLRAELFLFELDQLSPPYYMRGAYQCTGRIICRLRAHTPEYKEFIRQLCDRAAIFRVGAQLVRITDENINTDLCFEVRFAVPNLSSSISITLLEETDEEFHINGSPFAIEWLISRQALNSPFGTSDHRELVHSDLDCVPQTHHAITEEKDDLQQ